ncbi:helix-turn-helix transcriptional regulator [Streptomyces sp. SID3343]|uniref:helix-turn-helix domain-containing protein n=1 Tax=Streptomyces sp. SID3343 TaxID=2690260 RepID=UPI00136FC3A9|nr:helix-turn-helix transcriptional regulator [Streptomyces sp. SID3343]MYW00351.1 helix-turn-helix domain-containing protein [Streptomyces sp. SID3343]
MANSPNYARRRLGTELRRLRGHAGLSAEEAAAACGWGNKSKVSRIETAKISVVAHDLRKLAAVYGVEAEALDSLMACLDDTQVRRWWTDYADVLNVSYADFIGLEAEASDLRMANSVLFPGLLQSEQFARAIIAEGPLVADPETIDALVEVRMRRQRLLTDLPGVPLTAVVGEATLHVEVGGRDVLRGQLRHVLELSELAHVGVYVIPFSRTAASFIGGMTLMAFSESNDPGMLFIEYHGGMESRDSTREVRRYRRKFDFLQQSALSPDQSRELIQKRLESL